MVQVARNRGALAFALGIALATALPAQDFQRYLPHLPSPRPSAPQLPNQPKPAAGDARVLVERLRGVVLLDDPAHVQKDQLLEADGLQFGPHANLELLRSPCFREIVDRYLGKPVSLLSLNELVRDIIVFYRQNDRPVVDVIVPQQRVTNGVVQLLILEARVGQVKVEGGCYFNPCVLAGQLCLNSGDAIRESAVLEDVRWLSRNPFRTVDLELAPGEETGTTDVTFKIKDRRPVSGYIGYEDTGNRATGLERLLAGFVWGDALHHDHQFAYQYTAGKYFRDLSAHAGTYSFALPNRDIVSVIGGYASLDSDALGAITTNGRSWQTSVRYDHELYPGACTPRDCREMHLILGWDFKNTNSNLEFGGVNVFDSDADIVQWVAALTSRKEDCLGVTCWGLEAYLGTSGWTDANTNAAFNEIRPGATADYFYSRAYLRRDFYLPHNLLLVTRLTGQLAEGNLLPSEQLGLGGYMAVRGYDMRLINGDSGYIANVELQTTPAPVFCSYTDKATVQFLTFFDYGDARNHTLQVGEPASIELSSVGVGMRFWASDCLAVRADYAWPFQDVVAGPGDDPRAHIGVVLRH